MAKSPDLAKVDLLQCSHALGKCRLFEIGDAKMMKQVGDYVIETDGQAVPTWCVRMAGDDEYISNHDTETEALAAVARYIAADRRRVA